MIDSGATIQSICGLGQLKTLQKTLLIELDTITAGLVNFVFGIRNISSIGIVNLNTPLGMIVFYIV